MHMKNFYVLVAGFMLFAGMHAASAQRYSRKAVSYTHLIADGVEPGPETCPEEVYALYPNKTREEVQALFAEYKAIDVYKRQR